MSLFRRGGDVSYRALTIRQSPVVYPIQPEVPEAIDRLLDEIGPAHEPLRILEIGTGTGIIACALAAAGHRVTAVDVLPAAVKLARVNAARNGVPVELAVSDLCRAVVGSFDVVVFNVPNTIAVTTWGTFLQHVGVRALPNRLVEWTGYVLARWIVRNATQKRAFYRRLLDEVRPHLSRDGLLVLLVPAMEVDLVSGDTSVATARVETLQSAAGVRLTFLKLAAGQPGEAPSSAQ